MFDCARIWEAEIDTVATGKRIRELRKARGMTVNTICDAMGFNEPQAIYKWQRGDSLPTLQNLYKLSRLFEVKIDEIVVGTELDAA